MTLILVKKSLPVRSRAHGLPGPACTAVIILLLLADLGQAKQEGPAKDLQVPRDYLEVRYAMGRGDFAEAHARIDSLLRKEEIYPPLYETAAYVFVYERRFAAGHVFFDSLLAAKHWQGDIAGGHAILWESQQRPDSSLRYARLAVVENSHCVYPYEIFVNKSFELKDSAAAFELLRRQYQQHHRNWRQVFALALCHSKNNDFKLARDTLRALLANNDRHWRIYYALGYNLGNLESWQEAKNVHEDGLAHCQVAKDEEGRARLLHGRAQAELKLGKWQKAIATLEQGFESAHRIGNRVWEGRLMLLLGQIQLQQHQWSKAEQTLTTAAQRARQYLDGELLFHAYDYLSELALERGKRNDALAYAHRAFEIADSVGLKDSAASLLFDLALIEFEADRKIQALEIAQKAMTYVRSRNLDSYFSFGCQNLASFLTALGRYSEALNYCEQAQELAQKKPNFEQLLKLKLLRGEIAMRLGQAHRAHALLSESTIAAKNANLMTPFMLAQILLAQIEMGAQQYGQAKHRLAHALATIRETPAYETNLRILSLLAEIAWQTGQRAEAIKIYEDAARTTMTQTHRFGPQHLSSLSSVEREIFFGLSQAYVKNGQVERALAETERARDLIVKRRRWQVQQLRHAPTDSAKACQLAMLDSLLQKARVQKAVADSPEFQIGLATKIATWERQHAALQDSVLGMNAALWLDAPPFPIHDFRRNLRARREMVLTFFVGDSSTLVFFIAADTLRAASVAVGRHALEQQLLDIHKGMNTKNADAIRESVAKFDTVAARRLYRLLLQDFLAERKETTLSLVPDGVLHALPFEILPLTSTERSDAFFLIERFAVRYGSTLADLQQEEQDDLRVQSFLLAAAPVLQSENSNGSNPRNARWPRGTVGELEAEMIRRLVKCQTDLTGAKLTRKSLLPAMHQSDWLHIASHSFWQSAEPLFGEILLSTPRGMSEPERLFAFEIFQMSLPVKIAVLSGCETVRGTFVESEGFEGFVQAFRAAGTPSMIASLWKVDDYSTAEFFKAYYQALRAGQSTVAALQTAKLEILNHPNYDFTDWAAFAYYGRDWRVELPLPWGARDWIALAAIIAILLMAGSMLFGRKNRKAKLLQG